jgi:hypothetical protein
VKRAAEVWKKGAAKVGAAEVCEKARSGSELKPIDFGQHWHDHGNGDGELHAEVDLEEVHRHERYADSCRQSRTGLRSRAGSGCGSITSSALSIVHSLLSCWGCMFAVLEHVAIHHKADLCEATRDEPMGARFALERFALMVWRTASAWMNSNSSLVPLMPADAPIVRSLMSTRS